MTLIVTTPNDKSNIQQHVTLDTASRLEVLIAAARLTDGGPGGYGEWAYRTWAEHNEAYFGGLLTVGGIGWGLTPHGHAYGHYESWRNYILLNTSLVDPRSGNPWRQGAKMGERFASDVLLHEMVHQAIEWFYGGDTHTPAGGGHNTPQWVAEINRISELLGWPARATVVKQRRVNGRVQWAPRDGFMTIAEMAQWPHGLRADDYYGGDTFKRRASECNKQHDSTQAEVPS